jgi:hypothetical protein
MRKTLICALAMSVFLAASVFAADGYTVKSVTGKVELQASGDWKDVSSGMSLDAASVIKTGLNSQLVLTDTNGKTLTIKALKEGPVSTLASAGGIKLNKRIITTKTAEARGNSNVSTASTRASDAAADADWVE